MDRTKCSTLLRIRAQGNKMAQHHMQCLACPVADLHLSCWALNLLDTLL